VAKLPTILKRVFGRAHPDIYDAVKEYAEKKGQSPVDVVAAACASYLSVDEAGKEELEKAMAERRAKGGSGASMKPAIDMFKEMCEAMGTMFKSMNEARASLQTSSLISDYKAITGAASEIKKLGGESGGGSLEDKVADAFIRSLVEKFTGRKVETGKEKSQKKTGTGKVEDVSSPEE